MAVKLREKILSNGQVSFYLDIYHNKKRWYELLNIYITVKNQLKRTKRKSAWPVRSGQSGEHEVIVEDNGLIDKRRKMADFISFFESYIGAKTQNYQRTSTLSQLREFIGKKSFPISRLTTEWMKDFERFLLQRVSCNTTLSYLENINGALNELVRTCPTFLFF